MRVETKIEIGTTTKVSLFTILAYFAIVPRVETMVWFSYRWQQTVNKLYEYEGHLHNLIMRLCLGIMATERLRLIMVGFELRVKSC